MPPKRRRMSPLPFVGLSLALLLLPSALSQKVRLTVMGVYTPFQSLARGTERLVGGSASAGHEQELQKKVDFLQDEVVRQSNKIAQLEAGLAQVGALPPSIKASGRSVILAGVLLPSDTSPWRRSLVVTEGSQAGVRKGMLVVYNSQLVGRILETAPWASRVQLVTDPGFSARAVSSPRVYTAGVSFEKRHTGVYKGASGDKGQLLWTLGETAMETGSYVLTTEDPLNNVPAGLILGRVLRGSAGGTGMDRAEVEPALNFRGLETVALLPGPTEAE